MRFSTFTSTMPAREAAALGLTPVQEVQTERHWRREFAALLRNASVREWLAKQASRFVPRPLVRLLVDWVCDKLAQLVEPEPMDVTTEEAAP